MSIEIARDLVKRFEELTSRCAELDLALSQLDNANEYRKHCHCHVSIRQGSHYPAQVEVSAEVVRSHFQVALQQARHELRDIEVLVARLHSNGEVPR